VGGVWLPDHLTGDESIEGAPRTTVRNVRGLDLVLYQVKRIGQQGSGRSDLLYYHVYVGETYIGGIESYWPSLEDSTKSMTKEFGALPPGAKDWTETGTRQQVLECLASDYLQALQAAVEADLEQLRQRRTVLQQRLVEVDGQIEEKTARLDALKNWEK
jgi:hypothetical protein